MKRKLKIITAGTASLALLAPIGTVIACGDPKSEDPKMLSFDEFQKLMLKSELSPDKVATEAQKTSLKAIYDKFSLEKSKTFKVSIEETKENGTKEDRTKEEINASFDTYLLSKEGSPLEILNNGRWDSYKEDPKMPSVQKEMYKSIRDNFINEKNINKYLLVVKKYTDENGKLKSVIQWSKIMKKDNEMGGSEIHIFNKTLEDPKMLSLDELQIEMLSLDELQTAFAKRANRDEEPTKEQKAKIKEIFDAFKVEKSKVVPMSYEDGGKDGKKETIQTSVNLYLITKNGDKLKGLYEETFKDFSDNPKEPGEHKMNKYIRDNFLKESNVDKYVILGVESYKNKINLDVSLFVSLFVVTKKDDKIGLTLIDSSSMLN